MHLNVGKEVAALQWMTVKELRAKYAEAFGEDTPANNKGWLVKRIAWRLQALAEGGLSERARQRAADLANDADLRLSPPKAKAGPALAERTRTAALRVKGDDRLPLPGSVITRAYKGETLHVKVLPHGFEFEGEVYKSLSAVAKAITGQHCNGYYFFRLGKEEGR
jgi:poly-gamma-glutamate capsule biosynthesis protein CapA/YwtB (metallophosphatase superfamily)